MRPCLEPPKRLCAISNTGREFHGQDIRNPYAFLKTLPIEQHRRLAGRWTGKRRYNAAERLWVGTTDWMKAYPAGVLGHTAMGMEHAAAAPHDPKQPRSK